MGMEWDGKNSICGVVVTVVMVVVMFFPTHTKKEISRP